MIKINLLHPEKRETSGGSSEAVAFSEPEDKSSKVNTGAILGALILTIGVIGFMYFTQTKLYEKKQKTLTERKIRKAELEVTLQTIEELKKTKELVERKIKIIEELKSQQQNVVVMMDVLCNSLPEWLWLTALDFSGSQLNLSGKAWSNIIIADLINNLKSTNHFSNIEFPGSNRQKIGSSEIYDFRINSNFNAKIPNK